jgi:hypothetical protein
METRIKLTDSLMTVIMKMSEGNPGAATVLMQMWTEGDAIDPQNFMSGFGAICALDSFGIYGHKIWMLYKDVCGENIENTLAVLRACQLGQLPVSKMLFAIDNHGASVDISTILAGVKAKLPEFGVKQTDNPQD